MLYSDLEVVLIASVLPKNCGKDNNKNERKKSTIN